MALPSAIVEEMIKIPKGYLCPITKQMMIDPVNADDGYVYEREAIEEWLKTHDTSPKTNARLRTKELRPNLAKKEEIDEFLTEHPGLYEGDKLYLAKSWVNELIAAIKANQIKEVPELLTKDRRLLTLKLDGNYTAFHLACQFASPELSNILLESLIKRNQLDQISGQPPISGFKPTDLNALLEKSLLEADKAKCSLLLKLGAELNHLEAGTQNSLLHKLVVQGNPEAINWLLDQGLKIDSENAEGNTPLLLAVAKGDSTLVELLLKRGANQHFKNRQQESAIALAILKQNKPMLALLVGSERAALPPLHLAIELNDTDLMKALLKQEQGRASLETLDKVGRTTLCALVAKDPKEMKEKAETVKLLLDAGANPTVVWGAEKLTLLHLAARQGDLAVLKLLLSTKVATLIDAGDIRGDTALHLAAQAGRDNIIPALLEAEADHELRNTQEQTPAELAREKNKPETAKLIEQTARTLRRARREEVERLRQLDKEKTSQLEQQAKKIELLEKEIAKLKTQPKEEERKERDELSRSPPIIPQFQAQLKPTPKVSAEDLQTFLNHVVAGRQDEAEAMLKINRDLALASGTVTDHAKRTFRGITGFQYAVWALDWHMWKMIKEYLDIKEAKEQTEGFGRGSWVAEHGEHVNWEMLTNSLKKLINEWHLWNNVITINRYWIEEIGRLQLLLPMHVLQEYNQPARNFWQCPKFDAEYELTRSRLNLSEIGPGQKAIYRGCWFQVCYESDIVKRVGNGPLLGVNDHIPPDLIALLELYKVRIQQQAGLIAELARAYRHIPFR